MAVSFQGGELQLYDPDKAPVTESTESVLPDAPEAADKEVVEMQEDYVAAGCAHDVVPAKCLNHPYYLMIQEETEEPLWSLPQ